MIVGGTPSPSFPPATTTTTHTRTHEVESRMATASIQPGWCVHRGTDHPWAREQGKIVKDLLFFTHAGPHCSSGLGLTRCVVDRLADLLDGHLHGRGRSGLRLVLDRQLVGAGPRRMKADDVVGKARLVREGSLSFLALVRPRCRRAHIMQGMRSHSISQCSTSLSRPSTRPSMIACCLTGCNVSYAISGRVPHSFFFPGGEATPKVTWPVL